MFVHDKIKDIEFILKHPKKISGLAATIIGIISFLPVIYIVYKTKITKNFPYKTLILALTSNLLWIYYSTVKDKIIDKQLLLMGVLYFFIYTFILFTKIFN
tara:strand:+ start:1521 stop:1823 length:303 start_codon:yes stop_codon:yes gene_type:complete